MKRTLFRCLLTFALCSAVFPSAQAADPTPAPLPPVVARYEQMLASSPAKGTAFDKVYQHFFEGPGLDVLAARWQARAAGSGPGATTFPLLVGLLAERRAHPDEARTAYRQYNAAHPDDPRGWIALGELETSEGHFGPAADALAHALDPGAKPPVPASTRPTLYRELARAQARSFLVAASLGTWRKLAAEFPDDPGVLQEVGEAFQEDQAYDEARATFEKVRELARKNNDAFGRINATLRTGQVEEARGHAAEAVKIYEGVVAEVKTGSWLEREARARIEQLYRGQEDLPGLAEYYKKSLEDHPKDIEVATRRAAVLIELNRRTEAIDLLKQAVVWAPERQELQVELARRLGETDRPAEMAAVMEKLTTVAPEEKSYWQLLGDARWLLLENLPATATTAEKDPLKAQALAAWSHLSPPGGTDAVATGQLADLLAAHRLKDEAVAQYARAAALAPDLPDARERWAGYLAQIDRRDEARRVVAGIVTAIPANATAANFARLSTALDRLDDPVGALAATEQGLKLEPRNFDLLSQRWQGLASAKRWADTVALYPALLAAAPNPYFAEQVQARQVAALQAAGRLADTRAALAARLGALDENDLALLVRIDLQVANADTDPATVAETRRALDEARARFPRDAAFARLDGELARHLHDLDGQVAALRRLSDLQPAQKTDALTEITRVYRDAGRPDDALLAARELVLASPANAAAQMLLADLLLQNGQPDEGVTRLRDAVRLSDKPNEVRLRLARVQTDLGQDADARRTLDAAFEAAEDSHERLALTKQLAEAYQRENRLDELITRFQRLQQSDADGWRYSLYLAEIHQEAKDYGAARRELAKALAVRPRDGSLLRQLVRVAGDEQNLAEVARYQELLTEAEPSDQNKLALVTALLENNQAEAGFNALRTHLAVVLKTPGAWDGLLPLLARNDLTARAGSLLDAELGGDRADPKARFTLALFQAVAGNLEPARAALWSVFDVKTGPAPISVPAPIQPGPFAKSFTRLFTAIYTGDSVPEQRYRAGVQTRRTAQGLLSPGGFAGNGRGRGVFSLPSSSFGLPNTPSATDSARDAALVYLAALAVKDHTAVEFLAELDRHLAARDSSRTDRLVAASLMEDPDGETHEIAAQVQNPEPGLDGLALSRTVLLALNNSPQNRRYSENPPLTAAQAAALGPVFDPLLARLIQSNPTLGSDETDSLRYFFLNGIGLTTEAETVRREFLAHVDAHSSFNRLEMALSLLSEGRFTAADRAQLRVVVPAFMAAGQTGPASNLIQYAYLPAMVFADTSEASKLPPDDFADLLVSLIPLWYPPTLSAPGVSPVNGANFSNRPSSFEGNALPPGRFFDPGTFQVIGNVAQSLHQGNAARLDAVLDRLDRQARDLPPERRVLPALVAVYLQGLPGSSAAALPRAQALLATAPDDQSLRLLVGTLLAHADRHAEAVALLNTVDVARTGDSPFWTLRFLLTESKAAKDTESARRAALRLVSMPVLAEQRDPLAAELRDLGLTEQANALARPVASVSAATSSGRTRSIFDSNTATRLDRLVADKNKEGALALARSVLAALPPPLPTPNSRAVNVDAILRATLNALTIFKQTDAVITDAEKQLAQDPDSLTLNYQLAVLHQAAGGQETAVTGTVPSRHPDSPDPAVGYWRKLVALKPRDTRYPRLLANCLAARGQRDEAVTAYDGLLALSPDEGFANYEELRSIYHGSHSVALAKRMLAWNPGAVGPFTGGNLNATYSYFQVARECAAQKQPELVVALCRRGLEWTLANGSDQTADLNNLLFSTLLQLGRRDEARDALVADFLPPADIAKTGHAVQLGFQNPAAVSFNGSRRWLAGLSWDLDSVNLSGLRPVEDARSAGLLPDLQTALEARRKTDPQFFADNDLAWLLTMVRLDRHDPALLSELPALLNAKPGGDGNASRNINPRAEVAVRLAVAQRLLGWPGHEALALEAFRSAQAIVANEANTSNAFSRDLALAVGYQQARAELALDDPRSTLETLRTTFTDSPNSRAADGNENEAMHRALGLLMRIGPEADSLYVDWFARATRTPELRQSFYFAYDLERSIRAGDHPRFQALAWLLDDGGGNGDAPDATLVYELRPAHPYDKTGLARYPAARGRSFPGSEGERTLTFSYGPDSGHFAPIGQLKTDNTFGTWTGPVPPGAGVIEVTIDTPPSPDGSGDYWLRIVRTPNLMTNPRFDGLPDRDATAGSFSLPGWTDLPAGFWKQGNGDNPFPGRTFVRSDFFTQEPHTITGAKIPLAPGHAYFQSGWVRDGVDRSTVQLGRRYLDAASNVLKTSDCPGFSTLGWRWHSQRLLPGPVNGTDDAIPPGTAFVEPFLRVQGNNEWTGLFLGKID